MMSPRRLQHLGGKVIIPPIQASIDKAEEPSPMLLSIVYELPVARLVIISPVLAELRNFRGRLQEFRERRS
jgi:hypothetical protein